MSAATARSRLVDGAGVRLRVLTFGAEGGRDLLVLPGITSPAAVWDFVAEPLSEEGLSVHVLDLRGRGRSEAPANVAYALDDYAADAAHVVAELGLERPAIVGHSLGGRIAAALAVRRPELAGPLVIVDPPVSGPGRPPYPFPLAFYVDGIRAARARADLDEIRREHPGWTDAQLRARSVWLATCDEQAVAVTHRHFHDEDFHVLWDALAGPVLVTGALSPVVSPDAVAELLRRNPTARSIVVEGAGHMVPWDQPDEFLAAVRAALAPHPPRQEDSNA